MVISSATDQYWFCFVGLTSGNLNKYKDQNDTTAKT